MIATHPSPASPTPASAAVDAPRAFVLSDARGLQSLRDGWDDLFGRSRHRSVFTTWAWQSLWWKHYGAARPLRVVGVRCGEQLLALMPLYLDTQHVFRGVPVRMLRALGTGGDTTPDDLHPLIDAAAGGDVLGLLTRALAAQADWDVCRLSDLAPSPSFESAVRAMSAACGWRVDAMPAVPISFAELPSSWDAYLASCHRERRTALRYLRRRFLALPGAAFRICGSEELDAGIDRLIELHRSRWQGRAPQHAFASPQYRAFHRDAMHALQRNDMLRLYLLACEGRTVAAMYCYRLDDAVYYFQGGFDPQFGRFSPGQVLMGFAFESAMQEGCRVFDMLRGDHHYKAQWAGSRRATHQLDLYRPNACATLYHLRTRRLPQWKQAVVGARSASEASA